MYFEREKLAKNDDNVRVAKLKIHLHYKNTLNVY